MKSIIILLSIIASYTCYGQKARAEQNYDKVVRLQTTSKPHPSGTVRSATPTATNQLQPGTHKSSKVQPATVPITPRKRDTDLNELAR